ncbi:MAG: hypothetical protein RLZ12_1021, partial [Bacillota bacterium]
MCIKNCQCVPDFANEQQPDARNSILNEFTYNGASILPFTTWRLSDRIYFLLGEEAYGKDAGKWDDWGGRREQSEANPLVTATREFTEETMGLLGKYSSKSYIEQKILEKTNILADESKKLVTYISYFPAALLKNLSRNFYKKRKKLIADFNKYNKICAANSPKLFLLKNMLDKKRIGWLSN